MPNTILSAFIKDKPLPQIQQHPSLADLEIIKEWLIAFKKSIDTGVLTNTLPMASHLGALSLAVDDILKALFDVLLLPQTAIFAVGGYGRQQLYYHSDVDILIIYDDYDPQNTHIDKEIGEFIQAIWQLGITPAICVQPMSNLAYAVKEPTCAAAWLDSRYLCGKKQWRHLPYQSVKKSWSIRDFYDAKLGETKARHLLHKNTAYSLEPNIKNAPGGLRDVHLLGWLAKFLTPKHTPHLSVKNGFLLQDELDSLTTSVEFLSRLRHHLHVLTDKPNDNLSFDYQSAIAKRMGIDGSATQAAEQLMKQYYSCAMCIASLSYMISQLFFQTHIVCDTSFLPIDEEFGVMRLHDVHYLCIVTPVVFEQNPASMLRLFLVMGKYNIRHITPQTLRLLRVASGRIDDTYRNNAHHQRLFIQNLQEPNLLFHRLRLMKQFGVLGNYIVAFGQIMGLMQFDLFHRYTVDAHTLLLIRILHRFGGGGFGALSDIYQTLPKKYLLVIAAIFHDIAKGQKGDHSVLGATLAEHFCQTHHLPQQDRALIVFLVRHHLTMSLTAQKQDISDMIVIKEFADIVGNQTTLDYLYVLTVADMNATNSELWNNWRASLLSQLYRATCHFLSQKALDKPSLANTQKHETLDLLSQDDDFDEMAIYGFWRKLSDTYFLKHSKDELAWHAKIIAYQKHKNPPLVATDVDLTHNNLFKLLIYTKDTAHLFSKMVGVIDMAGFAVMGANIFTTQTGYALNTFTIIDNEHCWDYDKTTDKTAHTNRQKALCDRLIAMIEGGDFDYMPKKRYHNTLKHFVVDTTIEFVDNHLTELHLTTKDMPSLLAKIGQVFDELDIRVHSAKISTLGERAVDVFYLSDGDDLLLDTATKRQLKLALVGLLGGQF